MDSSDERAIDDLLAEIDQLIEAEIALGNRDIVEDMLVAKVAELRAKGVDLGAYAQKIADRVTPERRERWRASARASRLDRLRKDQEAGRIEAVWEAVFYCNLFQVAPPPWVVGAVRDLVSRAITRKHRRRVRGDRLHWERWSLVKAIRLSHECSVEAAVAKAAEISEAGPFRGSEPAFWKSYDLVMAALTKGEMWRFHQYEVLAHNNE